MRFQDKLARALRHAAAEIQPLAIMRFFDETAKPVTFRAMNAGKNPRGLVIQACPSGDPGLCHEMIVSIHLPDGTQVANIVVGLDPEAIEPRILVSADWAGGGDKAIAIFPERGPEEAVQIHNTAVTTGSGMSGSAVLDAVARSLRRKS